MPFLSQVAVRRVGVNRWQLLEDLCYRGKWDTFTAPAGFGTDFATVPGFLQSLVARTGRWDEAAVIHDLCCDDLARYRRQLREWTAKYGALERANETAERTAHGLITVLPPRPRRPWADARQTDAIFRRIMGEYSVGLLRRWLIWTAVRWGAIANPARRPGWWRDAPAVLAISLPVLALAGVLAVALVRGALDLCGG